MAAFDRFGRFGPNALIEPIQHAVAVTPSDTDELGEVTRMLYVGTTGDLKVKMASGETVLFTTIPAGFHALRVRQVFDTDTAANNIVACY